MNNFCTLFDSNFLPRGLAMYRSLIATGTDFYLYVFAFDDRCYEILHALSLDRMTVISLAEFEDEKLLGVKNTRSKWEYCWTSTPATILYCLDTFNLDACTYLDADLYFFSDPKILIDEVIQAGSSVLITEHRYTSEYDQTATSGIYCVQFMYFKNSIDGRKALVWWRDACIDWCYVRFEDGKFGDQKYLDDWTTRFNGVHVLRHLGGGVAPWNVQQYRFSSENEKVMGREISTGTIFEVVFFHFSNFTMYRNGIIDFGIYRLDRSVIRYLYRSYITALRKTHLEMLDLLGNGYLPEKKHDLTYILRKLRYPNRYYYKKF